MTRRLLHGLALIVLATGIAMAIMLPAQTLDVCRVLGDVPCNPQDLQFMRAALGVGAAAMAAVLYAVGSIS